MTPQVFNDPFVPPLNPDEEIPEATSYLVRFNDQFVGFIDTPGFAGGHVVTTW